MAVYTHVSEEELDIFLKDYQIGKLVEFQGISEGVENTNSINKILKLSLNIFFIYFKNVICYVI